MKTPLRHWVLMVVMGIIAAAGTLLRPTIMLADERPSVDLDRLVPTQFADWRVEQLYSAPVINPQQQETLERIYSQTLSRTYVNRQGYRIMLSVAYGRNQSKSLELHSPEICYPAQGFTVLHKEPATLQLNGHAVQGFHLETSMGPRHEPLTYWNVIGDKISTSMLSKRFVDLGYSVRGRIADGILMRVSSIDNNNDNAYAQQSRFSNDLAQAINPDFRNRFIGAAATP